jgi:hypothetical protein
MVFKKNNFARQRARCYKASQPFTGNAEILISPHPWGSTLRAFSLTLEVQFLLSCKNCQSLRSFRMTKNALPTIFPSSNKKIELGL